MNKTPPSQTPHDLLDAEERELAKIVRALPGGEPPSALDALILKAASDAVSSQPSQRKSRAAKGLLGSSVMWLGTAAASVLTVGVGWQVYQSIRAPINEIGVYEPAGAVAEKPKNNESDSMVIEMQGPRQTEPTAPPPPEALADDMAANQPPVPAPRPVAPVLNQAPAADAAASVEYSTIEYANAEPERLQEKKLAPPAEDWVTPPTAAPKPQGSIATETASRAVAAPAPVVASAPAIKDDADFPANEPALDKVEVTGSRIRRAESESASPANTAVKAKVDTESNATRRIIKDSELAPDDWLNMIKKRRDDGDIAGAKASIKKFQEAYPRVRIPNELKPLLK